MIDTIQKHPDLNVRLSTGPHQFGDDYPLYVMRGDAMIGFLHTFLRIAENFDISPSLQMVMNSYARSFSECIVNPNIVYKNLSETLHVTELEWVQAIESVRKSLCVGCKENDKVFVTAEDVVMHKRDYAENVAEISYPCTSEIIATILQAMSMAFVKKD